MDGGGLAEAGTTDGGFAGSDADAQMADSRDANATPNANDASTAAGTLSLRVATYNIADVRNAAFVDGSDAKLRRVAATIQRIRPDVLFLNELAYDQEGAPDFAGGAEGQNGQRFADEYLGVSQGQGLDALSFTAVMRPSNTGLPSGLDLDHTGAVVSAPGQGYGGDCWGYGDFAGQYALAVLVRADLTVRTDDIRTFQKFKWSALPGAIRPGLADEFWYADDAWAELRLSSKTHMDVPVEMADGTRLHLLASHPTPPAFDGPEDRNGARNHDEIRFWAEYIDDAAFLVDDDGTHGGLPAGSRFVIAGDMNADPDEGDSFGDPMGTWLLGNPKLNATFTPRVSAESDANFGRAEDDDDTASFGYRVDYVLPSADLTIVDGAVERVAASSDHAMVWIDVRLAVQQ
jgi:endonuclease/exonuclease/phosphatase family metal-dependent hydrolase